MTRRSWWARLAPRSRAGLIAELGAARTDRASLIALCERDQGEREKITARLRERVDDADRVRTVLRSLGHSATGPLADEVADALRATAAREQGWARREVADRDDVIGRIAVALGAPGAPTSWNVADLVERAVEAQSWRTRHTRMVQQAEALEADLIAVDEALAAAGATPADDRVEAIRALADADEQRLRQRERLELLLDAAVSIKERAERSFDGDVLRDAITDAVPRTITDEAARAFADQVLDGLVDAGMTVVHGPDGTPRPPKPAPATDDGVVDAHIYDAKTVGDVSSGGFVCGACGRSVEWAPCPEHQPDACNAFHAGSLPLERTVSIGWATPGVDRSVELRTPDGAT